jgi:hypothetical protein
MLSIIGVMEISFFLSRKYPESRRKRILGKRLKSSLGGNWLIDSCSTAEDADASNKKILKRNLIKI